MIPADDNVNETSKPAYRSRWGRFSPAMGWKAFWSEIVIVVLGVVIALAANESVQNWSWQNKVRDGEVRLQSDMSYLFTVAAEQYVIAPCAEAQLIRPLCILMIVPIYVGLYAYRRDRRCFRFGIRWLLMVPPHVFPRIDSPCMV
jgi:hypothetical protein